VPHLLYLYTETLVFYFLSASFCTTFLSAGIIMIMMMIIIIIINSRRFSWFLKCMDPTNQTCGM
jgi:type IV secretory pathway TrbL component